MKPGWRCFADAVTARIAVAFLTVGLSACAGAHLHDAEKASASKGVAEDWAKIDLVRPLTEQREINKRFLERDLDDARQWAVFMQRRVAHDMVAGDLKRSIPSVADARLKDLMNGFGDVGFGAYRNAGIATTNLRRRFDQEESTFRFLWGVAPPACTDRALAGAPMPANLSKMLDADPGQRALLQAAYDGYIKACDAYVAAKADENNKSLGVKGRLGQLLAQRRALARDRATAVQDAETAKAAVEQTERQLKQIAESATPLPSATFEALSKQLQDQLEKLEQAAETSGFGALEAAGKRIAAIDDLLKGLQQKNAGQPGGNGVEANPTLVQAGAIVKASVPIADHLVLAGNLLRVPPRSALIEEKEHLQAQQRFARKQIANADSRIAAVEVAIAGTMREIGFLEDGKRYASDNDLIGGAARVATGTYFGELGREVARQTLHHLAQERGLDRAVYAVEAHNAVISTPIQQVRAFHESGIKPEDLAQIGVLGAGLFTLAGTH